MASFSVTNNHQLRMIYMGNTDATKKSERPKLSIPKLNKADSSALKKGLERLSDYNMDEVGDDDEDKKKDFFKTVKAFTDAYNNTLESGSQSQNKSVSKLTDQLKKVSEKYADKLSDYGFSFDEKGYVSIKESAINNISTKKYKDVIGKDSDYAKELSDIAKKMTKHIDVAV